MQKIVSLKTRKRTRRRDFADGGVQLTFDCVSSYTLACGHVETRSHYPGSESKVGARLKCKTCTSKVS